MLRTNIELDEKLVDEAMKLTKKKTKKELVNFALQELVSKIKRSGYIHNRDNYDGNPSGHKTRKGFSDYQKISS